VNFSVRDGGENNDYFYDGANPVQELAGTTPTANMLTGLGIDEYLTRTDSSGTANFLTDALGSTIELTDGSGNSLTQYTYEPFGNTTATGTSSNTISLPAEKTMEPESSSTGPGIIRRRSSGSSARIELGFGAGTLIYTRTPRTARPTSAMQTAQTQRVPSAHW